MKFKTAIYLCRFLPPIVGQRVRKLFYSSKALLDVKGVTVSKSVTGSYLPLDLPDYHASKFALQGYFDWRNLAIALAVVERGDTIIEIGANVGTETVGFRDIVGNEGSVWAFEPLPANVKILKSMIELNNWDNVYVHELAIGMTSQTASFSLPASNWMSGVGFVVSDPLTHETAKKIEIKVVPLDSFVKELTRLKAIFIDVEGYECEVLKGAKEIIRSFKPVVVLEASPKLLSRQGSNIQELFDILASFSYTPFEVSKLSVVTPHLYKNKKSANWICVHNSKMHFIEKASKMIFWSGILPCIKGVNPLRVL